MKISAIFFLALIAAPVSHAGTWAKLSDSEIDACHFRFTGQIDPGDLIGYLDNLENSGQFIPRICLDSEGGALAEVYDFLRQLDQSKSIAGVSTRIESGASCLSACAILFMFGQTYGTNSPFPLREIEPGARLGFHSPFIAPGQVEGVDARVAFRVALDVAKLLIDSSYRALTSQGPALPPELVAVVLGTPGDEMHFVDMIGELTILEITKRNEPYIQVTLQNDRAEVGQAARRICASSHIMSNRQHFVQEGYAFADLLQAVAQMKAADTDLHHVTVLPAVGSEATRIVAVLSGPYWVPGWYSAGAKLFCRVIFDVREQPQGFGVNSYRVGFGTPMFDLDSRLPNDDEVRGVHVQAGLRPIDTRF